MLNHFKYFFIIICFFLHQHSSIAAEKTKQQSPPILEVSPQTMQKLLNNQELMKNAKTKKLVLASNSEKTKEDEEKEKEEKEKEELTAEQELDQIEAENTGADVVQAALHISSSGGGEEAALIVFALVGLVVVLLWVPYFPIFIYQQLKNGEKFQLVHLFSLHILGLRNGRKNDYGKPDSQTSEIREGYLSTLRYNLHLAEKGTIGEMALGVAFEFGQYKLKDINEDTKESKRYDGQFWMVGPSILFGYDLTENSTDDMFVKIDLLGGTSIGNDLGLVSKAEFSANLKTPQGLTYGLGIGALYLNVKDERGILTNSANLGLTLSANAGYTF